MGSIAIAGGSGGITLATGNIDLYVATTGSDSNPGTISQPFATIQHAANVAFNFNYGGLYHPTIHAAAGTYTISSVISLPLLFNVLGLAVVSGAGASLTIVDDAGVTGAFIANGWQVTALGVKTDNSAFQGTIQINNINLDEHTVGGGGPVDLVEIFQASVCFIFGTITVLCTEMDAYIACYEAATVSTSETLVLQATTSLHKGRKTFLNVAEAASLAFGPASITNSGGVSGHQLGLNSNGALFTTNGLLSDIPGTTGLQPGGFDLSGVFTNFATTLGSSPFMSFAGIPTTSQISPGFFGVYKDTSGGGLYVIANDAGTIKKVALV